MTEIRVFSRRLYSRSAVESAKQAFNDICDVQLEDVEQGTRATITIPEGATNELVGEFCNLALAAAIEISVAHVP